VLINIDLGELPDEPEDLYALTDIANIACGGHAGDDASMARAVALCLRHGAAVGAHPSFEDREGFGRRVIEVLPDVLKQQVAAQCARLGRIAAEAGVAVRYVKPHGALYHHADKHAAFAESVLGGAVQALGAQVVVIGPAVGELERTARANGLSYAREALADRGRRPDGGLIPRGEPGAVLTKSDDVVRNARGLLQRGSVDTLCIHGDSPGAEQLASALKTWLGTVSVTLG
jgi:UPF0271 protein